jgi:hypothetical protein
MTVDVTRSIHPDLLDEYQDQMQLAAGATAEMPPTAKRQRRGRGATAQSAASTPGAEQAPELPPLEAPVAPTDGSGDGAVLPPDTAEPEWLKQLRATSDPKEIVALVTRNVPREDLSRDDVLAGLIGDLGNKRARQMLEDQERQRQERARQEAYEKGDLYTLGQLEATNLQQQRQSAQAQNDPYLVAVRNFQAGLPEEVQREVQGKNYDSFGAYLSAVQDAAIRHGVSEEVKKRSGALEKAELSATVGSEQSPELDGGPAQAYREITDAQVAAMTLEEYDRHFDEKGRPRPGVRVRLERGIDVRRR